MISLNLFIRVNEQWTRQLIFTTFFLFCLVISLNYVLFFRFSPTRIPSSLEFRMIKLVNFVIIFSPTILNFFEIKTLISFQFQYSESDGSINTIFTLFMVFLRKEEKKILYFVNIMKVSWFSEGKKGWKIKFF